ncbi:MAG: polyhydroxyalkanoate synthesis repressor PhaR [Gammaproteobacteria bacterium]
MNVMDDMRIIKKYANRRLYDTQTGKFLNLNDIRDLVVSGQAISLQDARSGEDLTRSILLQIIVDSEEQGSPMLSRELLEYLIRFYGNPLQQFLSSYLEESVEAFQRQQGPIQKQMSELMTHGPASAMNDLVERNLDLWQKMQTSFLQGLRRKPEDESRGK